MKKIQLFLILILGTLSTNAQVSITNNTPGTLTGGSGHIDRSFIITSGNAGSCTSLSKVTLNLQLSIGSGTPCSGGGYGVHEDLNVRLVSPVGTTVDLVQDRWGYWTGNSSQSHSFNGFTEVNAAIDFDDDHTPNINSLNDWTAGNYAPHNPLSAFIGENPVGTWLLRISDGDAQFSLNDFYCFITGTLTICGGALPIELLSFSSEEKDKSTHLKWTTATEINNEKFEIEESLDGQVFQRIGEVEGKGTTLEHQAYSFEVKDPRNGISYYRLKQVDYDGEFEYSKVISANFKGENGEIGEFYPNPSKSGLVNLDYTSQTVEEISIVVFDLTGKLVVDQIQQVSSGNNNLSFDFSDLNTGIYIIEISDEKNPTYRKLIIKR